MPAPLSRLVVRLADTGPVLVLAAIAGAGSFTHIRDTAAESGQTGWMSWAVAVCVDLTCVMAARERQRDKKTGRVRRGWISWPTLVLVAGIVLSLAANLHQADPTLWGWLTAATPAGAFLVAVSMLERRATGPRLESPPAPSSSAVPSSAPVAAPSSVPALVPSELDGVDGNQDGPGPSPALVDYARRVADEHHAKHGKPITRDLLRARLGVSNQLASDLLRTLRTAPDAL
ncbi:SpdA protein [Microbispora amethystogenes]|nr:SpdA protein [Microbispora amethystogenes]